MNRFLSALVGLVPLCGTQAVVAQSAAQDPATAWTVKVMGAAAPGSGVVVRRMGSRALVLTSAHVLVGTRLEDQPMVMLPDGRMTAIQEIRYLLPLDLAEINLNWPSASTAPLASGPHQGGPVRLVGYPQDRQNIVVTTGNSEPQGISAVARPGGYALFHSASSDIGWSGSGLYDSQGRLIGIHGQSDVLRTHSGREYKSGIGLAIPLTFWQDQKQGSAASAFPPIARQIDPLQDGLLTAGSLQSRGKNDEALARLGQLITDFPSDLRARFRRATLYLSMGQYRLALEDLNRLDNTPMIAAVKINRGNAFLGLGRFAHAHREYNEAIRLRPESPWAHINLSKLFSRLGDRSAALKSLSTAIRLDSANQSALLERARLFYELRQDRQALDDLNRLIGFRDNDAVALALRGVVRGRLGDLIGSIDDLSSAISFAPAESMHRLNRGATLGRMGLWKRAEADFRVALKEYQSNPILLANLGESIFLQGRAAEGCDWYGKALTYGLSLKNGSWSQHYLEFCRTIKSAKI